MHKLLRNTHLILGLFCCLTLLMYGISSVQMVHRSWFAFERKAVSRELRLGAALTGARTVARELMDRHGVMGELNRVDKAGDDLKLRIGRPGTEYEATYRPSDGRTSLVERTGDWNVMFAGLHHVHGLWHENGVVLAWALLLPVISVALLVLGATGMYLWFKIHSERKIGAALLVISLGYSLTLMILIRAA